MAKLVGIDRMHYYRAHLGAIVKAFWAGGVFVTWAIMWCFVDTELVRACC